MDSRLNVILVGLTVLVACGGVPFEPARCRPRPVAPFGVGVAHVAGAYAVRRSSGEAFLQAGAARAHELGARTLKLFLTPDYATKYPQAWPTGIDSLETLAASAPFAEVLAMPFDTFVLTTYSFSMGTGDPWREGPVPHRLAAETREIDALVTLLATRYVGTGKTFVLQTWEGDWALLGGTDPTLPVPADRAERMAAWLSARHAAVEAARERAAQPGVSIVDAVEVNRVLDVAADARVTTDVLPNTCTDMVSYSAWESLDVGSLKAEEQWPELERRLTTALERIRANAPEGAAVFLGEFGFAENEGAPAAQLVERTCDVAMRAGVVGAVYWQLFDNECSTPDHCRGMWVMKPDGSLSGAGQALQAHWAKAQEGH